MKFRILFSEGLAVLRYFLALAIGGVMRRPFKNRMASTRSEERFLSAQADAFAGANAEERVGLLRSK